MPNPNRLFAPIAMPASRLCRLVGVRRSHSLPSTRTTITTCTQCSQAPRSAAPSPPLPTWHFCASAPCAQGPFQEKRSVGEGAPARGMQPDPGGVPVPWPKLDVGGQRGACSYASGCPVPLAGLISRVRGLQGGEGGSQKCDTVPAPSVHRRGRYLVRGQILHGAKKFCPRLARHAQIWKDGVASQVDPPLCPHRCTRPWTD